MHIELTWGLTDTPILPSLTCSPLSDGDCTSHRRLNKHYWSSEANSLKAVFESQELAEEIFILKCHFPKSHCSIEAC